MAAAGSRPIGVSPERVCPLPVARCLPRAACAKGPTKWLFVDRARAGNRPDRREERPTIPRFSPFQAPLAPAAPNPPGVQSRFARGLAVLGQVLSPQAMRACGQRAPTG
jgi:hypothetical protein